MKTKEGVVVRAGTAMVKQRLRHMMPARASQEYQSQSLVVEKRHSIVHIRQEKESVPTTPAKPRRTEIKERKVSIVGS